MISILHKQLGFENRPKTYINLSTFNEDREAVVAVIIWELNLQLHMRSVPITTDAMSWNFDQGKVYNIMW
jgi:hypothetical protein